MYASTVVTRIRREANPCFGELSVRGDPAYAEGRGDTAREEGPTVTEMPIGQLVKLYRIDRKLSTVYLATHADITTRYLEMIEAGETEDAKTIIGIMLAAAQM